jgi:hypothetical protein
MLEFFKQCDIATASRATFYRLQRVIIHPVVWQYWSKMQTDLLERFRNNDTGLIVTGDGQFDSPGHTAAYCFYSLVEVDSKKVSLLTFVPNEKNCTYNHSNN